MPSFGGSGASRNDLESYVLDHTVNAFAQAYYCHDIEHANNDINRQASKSYLKAASGAIKSQSQLDHNRILHETYVATRTFAQYILID